MFVSLNDIYNALDEGESITKKFPYSHPTKTEGKTINLSLGRIW